MRVFGDDSGIVYVSPVQNWAKYFNPANLLNPLDYFLNINEIDEQLEAIKLGLA
jgi:hypothetical protein